jgi:hypothetical protein
VFLYHTHFFLQSNDVFYTVVTKTTELTEDGETNNVETTEEITAKQLLATRPILVEVYEYKNDVTIETRVERRIEKCEQFPKTQQNMIVDYFEVKHSKIHLDQKKSNVRSNLLFINKQLMLQCS